MTVVKGYHGTTMRRIDDLLIKLLYIIERTFLGMESSFRIQAHFLVIEEEEIKLLSKLF